MRSLSWLTGLVMLAVPAADATEEFFEAKVRPLLAERCYSCHGPSKQRGGLRLDTREGVREGGTSGPAIVAGKPADSPLIQAVRYADPDLKMPPDKPLSPEQVAVLTRWVELGAPDPRTTAAGISEEWQTALRERRQSPPSVAPPVRNGDGRL